MQWKIDDGELAGPINFGTELSSVKDKIGDPSDQFKRTPDSDDVVYAYDDKGVHLSISGDGKLSQLIVFPDNEVFIGTTQLLGKPIESIYSELNAAGVVVEREDAGLWCEKEKVFLVEIEGLIDGVEIYSE